MKKIVVLNGSPHQQGNTMKLVNHVIRDFENSDVKVKEYQLNRMNIKGCQGCYACKKDGTCVLQDDMKAVLGDIKNADGVILATPVYMGQMTAQLKIAVDRFYSFSKMDFSSFLESNKKVLLVITQGSPVLSAFGQYFDSVMKVLSVIGFGDSNLLIEGGVAASGELINLKDKANAKLMMKWLIE